MAAWNSCGTKIVAFSMGDLVEHRVTRASGQALEIRLEHAILMIADDKDRGCRGGYRPTRAIDAYWNRDGRQRPSSYGSTVEDQLAVPHLDRVSWEGDHALDEIGVLRRHPEDDDIAAPWQCCEDSPADWREAEWEAVAGKPIGPFRNDKIVADIERRKHRSGRDIEGLNDKASERPSQNYQNKEETHEAPSALLLGVLCRATGAGRAGSHPFCCLASDGWRSSRGGIYRPCHYVPAMTERQKQGAAKTLKQLFEAEPDRLSRLTFTLAGIYFDWSKTHLDSASIDHFLGRAREMGFAEARDALFGGEIVNPSESRPATHIAERGSGAPDDVDLATARRQRMRALIDAIEGGAFGELSGILHIGIGGSVLGPALLVDALGRRPSDLEVRFLSNIDGAAFDEAVASLDPATTLVVVASKTFSTLETLTNLNAAREWLREAGVEDPDGRLIAVTASPETAVEQGIDESRILQFGEGVGGRYSLWSSVGLSAALALGWDAFEALLEGAAETDRHFRFAELRENVPLIAAFADRLYVETFGCQTRGLFAYDERLRLLPFYLQQLEMESNGKSVAKDGKPAKWPTAPVTWGGTGTDAQHAVFQLLHQGMVLVPVEFVAVSKGDDDQDPEHHRLLLLNAFAQGAALMEGRRSDDPQRNYPGNRPSSTILLGKLDPRALGALIAFYEHRTFSNAVLLGINPFDQFGVELGKQIARQLATGSGEEALDASTRALIERAGV